MRAIIRNHKVRSSALGYSISFLLIVGLVASGVLFIASANKRIEWHYSLREHVLMDNYMSLLYGSKSPKNGTQTLVHSSGDTSHITTKNWGAYRVVVSETRHPSWSSTRAAIVGYVAEDPLAALYVPDRRQTIKLCGKTKLEGTIYVPERGLERGYLTGKNFAFDKLLDGILKKSEKRLPPLADWVKEEEFEHYREQSELIEWFDHDSTFSFSQKTRMISSKKPMYIRQHLAGNLVLHSFDSVVVFNEAKLENILIIAPYVRFESGFKGSVQVIANEQVLCEKNVRLLYPSTIILHEEKAIRGGFPRFVRLEEGAQVLGGILLKSDQPNGRNPLRLEINHGLVAGLVYNTGETELKGSVIGHVYTSSFDLQAGGGKYGNYLLDATISSKQLPNEFISPLWLKNQKGTEPKILSCF